MSARTVLRPLLKGAAVFVRELLKELADPEPATPPAPVEAGRRRPEQRQQPVERRAGR